MFSVVPIGSVDSGGSVTGGSVTGGSVTVIVKEVVTRLVSKSTYSTLIRFTPGVDITASKLLANEIASVTSALVPL